LKVINSLADAVSRFGASLKPKLSGQGAVGAPEDQLRAPLEALIADIAAGTRTATDRAAPVLHRWRDEAVRAGRTITRIAVAFEAGRDGFWLARWLEVRGVDAPVIHPSSVAVSREHRRAKTDRLDTELLKRGFLGWLGE
jgi:hypothetical protein